MITTSSEDLRTPRNGAARRLAPPATSAGRRPGAPRPEWSADRILDRLPGLVWTVDRHLRLTGAGGTGADWLPGRPGELTGRAVDELPDGELRTLALDAHMRALAGETVDLDVPVGDRIFTARVAPIRGEDGAVEGVGGTALDSTSRHEAHRALAAGESGRHELTSSVREAIVRVAADGTIREGSAEAARLLGRESAEDLVGMAWAPPLPPLPDAATPRARFDFPAGTLQGQDRRFEVLVRRVDSGDRVVTLRDVTELRVMEEQFQEAQKMEAVGRLSGGIAHDFRNLLTVVRANAELILMDVPLEHPLRPPADEIAEAAKRGADLVGKLMAYARQQERNPRAVDLNEVVRGLEPLIRRVTGEDVSLVVELCDDRLGVMVDPVQVEQVLLNLITNARDAMPGGGRLSLRTGIRHLDEAYCRSHAGVEPGPYARLSVRDTGHGMGPEVREHIFEPFYTTKDVGKGTGLGLASVHGIVRQSQGHIWVYSEPGEGTVFRIYLPLFALADPPARTAERPEPVQNRIGSVLLVEDDDSIRTVLQQILQRRGVRVLAAGTGEEALDLARSYGGRLDCLVTDVTLPGIDGQQVARVVRADRPDIRIALMSGWGDGEVDHAVMQSLDAAFLEKPFPPEALLRLIDSLANGASPPPPPAATEAS